VKRWLALSKWRVAMQNFKRGGAINSRKLPIEQLANGKNSIQSSNQPLGEKQRNQAVGQWENYNQDKRSANGRKHPIKQLTNGLKATQSGS
jgi:hypothetical protein